ncbi:helix-turn-helix domain-containing protein [Streptomyces botrytidirepellens]|uniref:Helix-turn-helix domain-containing protein n=1 Tax=Streptomyces botrytidirepellens TaxID=2486417 RepID=A0A3M8VPZ7_9ACTN|nr:helix-turn-helix domain-containing protein [Streptomyces botrytidirepellens]RNG17853.1 helix-turn-helix domain-containing protein [Streptomyces botrytidirepellens]
MASRRLRLIDRRKAIGHTQESLAEAMGTDRTTVGRWESGQATPQPWMRPKLARVLNLNVDQLTEVLDLTEASALVRTGAVPTQLHHTQQSNTHPDMATAIAADSAESALFIRIASSINVDDILLEQLEADISRLALEYVTKPAPYLVHEVSSLRRSIFDLLQGRQAPHQTARLYLAAGYLSGLVTHIALDLGQYPAAATNARASWLCAENAGHNGLRAWVRSIQSLIAYWQCDYAKAAKLAQSGMLYNDGGTISPRLLSLQARAYAAMGDRIGALQAIESAANIRADISDVDLPGVFVFPEAKQWTYVGTALLALNDSRRAATAITASQQAIALYSAAPDADQSSGDLLAAHLDLVNGYLASRDIDCAEEALTVVIQAPPEHLTASITKRLSALDQRLSSSPYASPSALLSLREQVRHICSRSRTSLPFRSQVHD